MNATTIATFESAPPAEALKRRYVAAGIPARVHNESRLQRFGFLTAPAASHKVEVPGEELERALALAREWDAVDRVLESAVRCPECRSARIEYPQFTRKFVVPFVVEIFISLGLFPKEYYCVDCQYTWPKETKAEPERDDLGWPVKKAPPVQPKSPAG